MGFCPAFSRCFVLSGPERTDACPKKNGGSRGAGRCPSSCRSHKGAQAGARGVSRAIKWKRKCSSCSWFWKRWGGDEGRRRGRHPTFGSWQFLFFSGIPSLLFLSFSLVPWADCCKGSRCQRPVLISLSHSESSQCKCMHVLDCIVVALCSTHVCGELAFCWLFGGVAIGAPPPPCLWLRMQLRARFCEVFHCVVCTWSRVPDLGLPRAALPLCARRRLVDLPPSLRPLPRL